MKALAPLRLHRSFKSKDSAVSFARSLATEKRSGVLVHDRLARLRVDARDGDVMYEIVLD